MLKVMVCLLCKTCGRTVRATRLYSSRNEAIFPELDLCCASCQKGGVHTWNDIKMLRLLIAAGTMLVQEDWGFRRFSEIPQ